MGLSGVGFVQFLVLMAIRGVGSTIPDVGSTIPDVGSTILDVGSTIPDVGSMSTALQDSSTRQRLDVVEHQLRQLQEQFVRERRQWQTDRQALHATIQRLDHKLHAFVDASIQSAGPTLLDNNSDIFHGNSRESISSKTTGTSKTSASPSPIEIPSDSYTGNQDENLSGKTYLKDTHHELPKIHSDLREKRSDDRGRMGAEVDEILQTLVDMGIDVETLKQAVQNPRPSQQVVQQLTHMSGEIEALKQASQVPQTTPSFIIPAEVMHNLTQLTNEIQTLRNACVVTPELKHNLTQMQNELDILKHESQLPTPVPTMLPEVAQNITDILTEIQSLKQTAALVPGVTQNMTQILTEIEMLKNITEEKPNVVHNVSWIMTEMESLKNSALPTMTQNLTDMLAELDKLKAATSQTSSVAHNVTHVLTEIETLKNSVVPSVTQNITQLVNEIDVLKNSCTDCSQVTNNMTQMLTQIDMLTHKTEMVPNVTHKMAQIMTDINALKTTNSLTVPDSVQQQLDQLSHEIRAMKFINQYPAHVTPVPGTANSTLSPAASTYIRWGSSDCPGPDQLVYEGILGGGGNLHSPSAPPNHLCLTMEPSNDRTPVNDTQFAELYGGEYKTNHINFDQDPRCAVCRVPRPTTMMIPGTSSCPLDWTYEYSGHLMASSSLDQAGSEFICVDWSMERRWVENAENNDRVNGLFLTRVTCLSMPCPPYHKDALLVCAVCSK